MPTLAAIDIGSNALRLMIAGAERQGQLTMRTTTREPVRLGQDVFSSGVIGEANQQRLVAAMRRFAEEIDRANVRWTRAVATSAMREARNASTCVEQVSQETGIRIDVIGTEEEARLIHLAVASRLDLGKRLALLIDIGGGSTEITLSEDGNILSTASYSMGAVRLLQLMEGRSKGDRNQLVREYVDAMQRRIKKDIGDREIDLLAGTGGNIESLGDLSKELLGRTRDDALSVDDLEELVKELQNLSVDERISRFRLRPDRADVIVPAAIVLQRIAKIAGVKELHIPRVGLKDGVLFDMAEELFGEGGRLHREQIVTSALELGRKYRFDEQHATTVARHAVRIFDQTRPLHSLDLEHRVLLEAAALLHDIGQFVNVAEHHKHTQYLLLASPFVGLNAAQLAVVAHVARYHRKSAPKPQHETFKALPAKEREVVTRLAAILRLADALDNQHASHVRTVTMELKKEKVIVELQGEGDLLLEKWALLKKASLFEEEFGMKVVLGTV
jgi:exopolyphosphatase / guanosine-5'-triphosphate,3'-diphosphate pyrophosphatase